jgi:hypothetical protein
MSDPVRTVGPRQKAEFALTVTDLGRIKVKVFDRINVDDVTVHLTVKYLNEILAGTTMDLSVGIPIKDFLVRERFRLG